MKDVFICSPLRTPIGSFNGSLASLSAPALGAEVIKAILEKTGIDAASLDEVIMGCVLTANVGQAPARQALIAAGIPNTVQALTVNKVCSSGLKAVMLAANQVQAGISEAVIAGGMESMSNAPYYLSSLRSGARLGHTQAEDSIVKDGLWDPYNDYHMGSAAELCAREFSLDRESQDAFALESYERSLKAISEGAFKDEIVPVTIKSRKSETVFEEDEEPKGLKKEKVPTLRPVFEKDGTVTAANASSINDGASAMLVCSEEFVKKNNLKPIARVVSQGWNAQAPEWFTTAPVGAVENAIKNAGSSLDKIDLFEINEAFSAVALACSQKLEVDSSKLNVNGGAVSLGHPIGASGARILTTLLHALNKRGKSLGVAGICNGGGEATSVVVERV